MYYRRLTLLFLLVSCCLSCKRPPAEHSFYYWKTSIYDVEDHPEMSAGEKGQYNLHHIYLHYFDVDWSENRAMPVPTGEFYSTYNVSVITDHKFTPVVYITNRTFERLNAQDSSCEWLAKKVSEKVKSLTFNMLRQEIASQVLYKEHISYDSSEAVIQSRLGDRYASIGEIQIDCDWTAGTRDKYFRFLKAMKRLNSGKDLSATIRLYPYKYPDKTGIPPVDRGMLMCYNLGNIRDVNTGNSVFDIATLKQYLDAKPYPLQLDIAFPIFGWYAWFRGKDFKGIIYDDPALVEDSASFIQQEKQRFLVRTDTVLGDNYFRSGDILRREYPDSTQLSAAITLVKDKIPDYKRIAFYHWNQSSINRYEKVIKAAFADR